MKCTRFELARSLTGFQALRVESKLHSPGCYGICAYCQLWNNAKQFCVVRVILSYEGPALTMFVLRSRGGDSIQCTRLSEVYGYDVHIVVECLFGIAHSFRENCFAWQLWFFSAVITASMPSSTFAQENCLYIVFWNVEFLLNLVCLHCRVCRTLLHL